MKRIMLAAAFGLITLASFAKSGTNPITVPYSVKESFNQQFGYQKDISWSYAKNDLIRADFSLEGQLYTAFFNKDGDHLATTLAMDKSDLPIRLRIALDQELKGKSIDELFFVEAPSESAYYFSAKENGSKKVYRAYENGQISEVSKQLLK